MVTNCTALKCTRVQSVLYIRILLAPVKGKIGEKINCNSTTFVQTLFLHKGCKKRIFFLNNQNKRVKLKS